MIEQPELISTEGIDDTSKEEEEERMENEYGDDNMYDSDGDDDDEPVNVNDQPDLAPSATTNPVQQRPTADATRQGKCGF